MIQQNPRESSKAIQVKEQIDGGEIDPTHDRVELVCKRLLRLYGYDRAYSWVKEAYGDNFRPEDTKEELAGIIQNRC